MFIEDSLNHEEPRVRRNHPKIIFDASMLLDGRINNTGWRPKFNRKRIHRANELTCSVNIIPGPECMPMLI